MAWRAVIRPVVAVVIVQMCQAGAGPVEGVLGAKRALQALHSLLAEALPGVGVAHVGPVHCAPQITLAQQAAQRVGSVQAVEARSAGVAPPALHVGLAGTLARVEVAGTARSGASRVAPAGSALSERVQAVVAGRAGVAAEPLHMLLALAAPRERVAELVQGAVGVATARAAAVGVGLVEELEAVVAPVAVQAWQQRSR